LSGELLSDQLGRNAQCHSAYVSKRLGTASLTCDERAGPVVTSTEPSLLSIAKLAFWSESHRSALTTRCHQSRRPVIDEGHAQRAANEHSGALARCRPLEEDGRDPLGPGCRTRKGSRHRDAAQSIQRGIVGLWELAYVSVAAIGLCLRSWLGLDGCSNSWQARYVYANAAAQVLGGI